MYSETSIMKPKSSWTDEVLEKYRNHVNPSLARLLRLMGCNIVEEHSSGSSIFDTSGRRYIDCLGGYGVFSAGHRHPRIIRAVKDQLDKMPLGSKVFLNKPLADLSEALARVAPGNLQYSFFCNSGTEAVEGALKLARLYTGRREIISTNNSFHGKTFGALSATGREMFRKPFEPLLPCFKHVPYNDANAIREAITGDTAAVILEPIQGEGGIIVPDDDYLPAVRKICTDKGVLLIADEIQTGLGRTGKTFACQHWNIVPDILVLAKALGGGVMPVGAFMSTPEIWKSFAANPLIHTSTFGGNPLACVAALEFIEVLEEERLSENANHLGNYLMKGLNEVHSRYPQVINEVRGKGLMIGVELTKEGLAGVIFPEMVKEGVLTAFTLNNPKVIRFEPPLVITKEEINTVLQVFEKIVEKSKEMASKL
jgi:putrescine aminotransferase